MHRIETEQERIVRWIAGLADLPGVLACGATREEAVHHAHALSLRVLAEGLDHSESIPGVQAVLRIVA